MLSHSSKGSSFGISIGVGAAAAPAIVAGIGIPGGGGRFSGEKREFIVMFVVGGLE